MALEKLQIRNLDSKEDPFFVLFNPTEYTVEDANSWQEQERERRKPELQFTAQSLKKLSLELFADTYEQKEDVRRHTAKLAALLEIDPQNGKRPPICQLEWGGDDPSKSFPFRGVLESLKQQFVLFLPDGTPVRARMSVAFKEYVTPVEEEKENPKANSFPAQTYTVKAGDTLSSIAGELWRRPTDWRRIAAANDIDDPRDLAAGRVLAVPAVE